jgi:hypothetical protein
MILENMFSIIPYEEAFMNNHFPIERRFINFLGGLKIHRGLAWGLIILGALLAFEIFNYSTTEFALKDVLGQLNFVGVRWSTILAIAFCGIDFAGIARLFTPEQGKEEPAEVWYLFGAWLLAASMNAILTWWGVSVAIVENGNFGGNTVVNTATLMNIVPVFVAMMVWLIRVLIIGTFSVAGDRLFSQSDGRSNFRLVNLSKPATRTATPNGGQAGQPQPVAASFRPSPRAARSETSFSRPEPSYHNITLNTKSNRDGSRIEPLQ